MIPNHYINIYQKPAQGNTFLTRKLAYHYRHQIAAMGWFDTASCDLAVYRTEGEYILENWVGNRVAVYVDNPVEAIWEGLISRISFSIGNVTVTRSLDDMFNRTKVVKTYMATSATVPVTNAGASQLFSQAIYGIKEGTFDGGTANNLSSNTGHADSLRGVKLVFSAWPQTSIAVRGGGDANIVNLEMIGFYHTLDWEGSVITGATSRTPTTILTVDLLPGLANGATFFDNTDTSAIATNSSWTRANTSRTGQTVWQLIQTYTEAGDTTVLYVAGIEPTNPGGTRRLYYRQANTTVEYIARADQGLRLFNKYGKYVPPWRVRPDAGIRITDILPAWNSENEPSVYVINDPRDTYIQNVQYDAEQQAVYWQGGDDITVEGAFQLNRYYKSHGRRFGANIRTIG